MRRMPDQVEWKLSDTFVGNNNHRLYPITFGYQTCPPGFVDEILLHYYLICCTYSGSCTFFKCPSAEISRTEGAIVNPGESFLISPGTMVSYTANTNEPWVNAWFGFYGEDAAFYLNSTPFRNQTVVKTVPGLYDTLMKLTDSTSILHDKSVRLIRASSVLWQIFADLSEEYDTLDPRSSMSQYTQDALDLIHKTYNTFSGSHAPITISGIAAKLCISREYLCKLFKADTGKSPSQYLLDYRMDKACSLLRECDYPIHLISQQLGFYDHAYFTKKFKEAKGISPSQYSNVFKKKT